MTELRTYALNQYNRAVECTRALSTDPSDSFEDAIDVVLHLFRWIFQKTDSKQSCPITPDELRSAKHALQQWNRQAQSLTSSNLREESFFQTTWHSFEDVSNHHDYRVSRRESRPGDIAQWVSSRVRAITGFGRETSSVWLNIHACLTTILLLWPWYHLPTLLGGYQMPRAANPPAPCRITHFNETSRKVLEEYQCCKSSRISHSHRRESFHRPLPWGYPGNSSTSFDQYARGWDERKVFIDLYNENACWQYLMVYQWG
jgi:hypothetical protein